VLTLLYPLAAPCAELTHTMAVGGVTSTSARVWVRISAADTVNVEVATDPGFGTPLRGSPRPATAEGKFAVIIDLDGLQPDTRYFLRATIGSVPQPRVQTFQTFPVTGTASAFTFGFGSCQQSGSFLPSPTTPGNVYRQVMAAQPRFFLQLGDWGYPDSTDNAPFDSSFFAADYARVQDSYLSRFRSDYLMDTLLSAVPVDYVYDDHDFMNNNASARTSSFYVPFRPNPLGSDFAALELTNPPGARENSIRGYRENMPTYPLVNESRGIYHRFSYGNVDVFALDLRSQRSPTLAGFSKDPVTGLWRNTPPASHSILGRDDAPGTGTNQLSWLLQELKQSTATWKFLMSSVPFNRAQVQGIQAGLLLQNTVIDVPELPSGTTGIFAAFEFADKWAGYEADIDTLLDWIAGEGVTNVIVLSGDSHTAAIDDGTNAGLPEIMAGGLDITNSKIVALMNSFGIVIWNKGGQGLTSPDFNNAFGRVTVFGDDSVDLSIVDEFGTLVASHVVRAAVTGVPAGAGLPARIALEQNYPNPFNPVTRIRFSIGAGSGGGGAPGSSQRTTLAVYDLLGRPVAVLVDELMAPGSYEVTWDARSAASGAYVCRLRSGGQVQSRTMLLVR
jgi:phosphodiesterase/alkaline phosphatase D-like protein